MLRPSRNSDPQPEATGATEPALARTTGLAAGRLGSAARVEAVTATSLPMWTTAAHPAPEPASAAPAVDPLIERALAGDAAAFGDLIDRHERAALAVAYSATRDAGLAADAVQEGCLKAWHKRHTLADPTRFAGWLLHIVRRCALDQLRSRKPVQSLSGMDEAGPGGEADASLALHRREMDQRVRAALEELDDESRLAVVMRYYDGSSAKQIADVLGCSPAAVDMRLKRARDRLREKLADLNEAALSQ